MTNLIDWIDDNRALAAGIAFMAVLAVALFVCAMIDYQASQEAWLAARGLAGR